MRESGGMIMKIEKTKPTFSPITITIETQEEADAFYCLFNHLSIDRALDVACPNVKAEYEPFQSPTCQEAFEKFAKHLKRLEREES
jgi:hypothetical protein